VDFPAPSPLRYPDEPAAERSWRRAAIITGAIAGVELVILLVIVLAFIAKPFTDDAGNKAKAAEPAKAEASAPAGPRTETPVIVLNGNGVAGAAGDAAGRVRDLDYPVVAIADASRRDFSRTIVMYRDDSRTAAVRLARDLGLPARRAVPLDGMRLKDLQGAELALVLGRAG
jgi:hypothetical protein